MRAAADASRKAVTAKRAACQNRYPGRSHAPGVHAHLTLAAMAALVSAIALPGASAPARAQDGVTAGTAGQSVRRLALAPVTDNPAIGNQGFTVLVKGNAALNATATGGPLALGGNLTFNQGSFSNFNLATQTAGTFTAPGDSRPTGTGNNFSWSPSNFSGLQNASAGFPLWNFPTATARPGFHDRGC